MHVKIESNVMWAFLFPGRKIGAKPCLDLPKRGMLIERIQYKLIVHFKAAANRLRQNEKLVEVIVWVRVRAFAVD